MRSSNLLKFAPRLTCLPYTQQALPGRLLFGSRNTTQAREFDERRISLAELNKRFEHLKEAGKPTTVLTGTVEKILEPVVPSEPEKAQIAIEQAEPLYKESRIENALTDVDGKEVKLKHGATVDVVIQADPVDIIK